MQQIDIPCDKCHHPHAEIMLARFHYGRNERGEQFHQQTEYVLRCANAACGHGFTAVVRVEIGKEIALEGNDTG